MISAELSSEYSLEWAFVGVRLHGIVRANRAVKFQQENAYFTGQEVSPLNKTRSETKRVGKKPKVSRS
jgi:hypothetical protein